MNQYFTIFDFAKSAFVQAGIKPAATWDETRQRIRLQAEAQLRRKNVKPATIVKWHRLGAFVGIGR